MAEQPNKGRRKGHPDRREQPRLHGNGPGGFPSRSEAAIEHYEYKRYGANLSYYPGPLRRKSVILAAAQKAEHKEEEQDRYPDLSGKLVEKYAGDDNSREYQ